MNAGIRVGRIQLCIALALSAGAACPLGCERRDPRAEAIAEAANTLEAGSAGGSAAAPRSVRKQGFEKAAATIQQGGTYEGEEGKIADAITGESIAAQAGIVAATYRDADNALLIAINEARAKLLLSVDQRSISAALGGYDPAIDIGRYDELLKQRQAELGAAQKLLEANDAKVKGIADRAKARAGEGRAMRETEAPLQQQLMDAEASVRPELAKRLSEMRRKSQAVMMEAELLEAEAAQVAPISVERTLGVQRVNLQIESLKRAKEQTRELAAKRQEHSESARAASDEAGRELAAALGTVRQVLSENVKPAYEDALSKLSQAASKWASARGGPSNQLVQLAGGDVALSTGLLQREYAESVERVRQLVDMAANLQPPLESAAELREGAATLSEEIKQVREGALASYEKAKTAFESGGGSGEAGERVQRLATRVGEAWVRLGGKGPEPEPAPVPETPPAETDPAADPASADPIVPPPVEEQPAEVPPPASESTPN